MVGLCRGMGDTVSLAVTMRTSPKGSLPIVCHACHRTIYRLIAELQQAKAKCPHCGKEIKMTAEFRDAIKGL